MHDDGLYRYYENNERDEDGNPKDGYWLRVADRFDTPALVSDPTVKGNYGLLVEFSDESGRPHQTVISAAAMHDLPREICGRLSGLGLFIDRGHQDELVSYLQQQMKTAPSADQATTPGWLKPDVFVLPGEIFGKQDNGRAVYWGGGDPDGHYYHTSGTLAEWQRYVACPCEGNSRAILAISVALSGPLMMDAAESSGGVNLYGRTSKGKTTTIVAGGSTCGGGDSQLGFVRTLRTTLNGLEPVLSGCNDGAVYLDELAQCDPRTLAELSYMAAGNGGKSRMSRDLRAAPTFRWRDMIVTTGEITFEQHARKAGVTLPGGAAVRFLNIPADAGAGLGVFDNVDGKTASEFVDPIEAAGAFADRLRASALRYYGTALRAFLRYLVCLTPDARRAIILDYRAQFMEACKLVDAGPEVLRAASRMGVIAAGGELGISWDILPWPAGSAIDGVVKCFAAWREARGGDAVAHDDGCAIAAIRLFLGRFGRSRFEFVPLSMTEGERVTDRAGWRRRTKDGTVEYLIPPEFFAAEMCKGYDPSMVARALHSRGYLHRQGRCWTITTTIPNEAGKRRVFCILDSLLAEESA